MGKDPTQLFRKKALDKLARAESPDDTVTIVTTRSWILLSGFYTLVLALLVWSIWGSIPVWVEGQGLLLYGHSHIYKASVISTNGGAIQKILVQPGEHVLKNQVVALVAQPQLAAQVKTAAQFLADSQAQYHALLAEAQQQMLLYQQRSEQQQRFLDKIVTQTIVKLNANADLLAMTQKLFNEGVEDKISVVSALEAYQDTKNAIDTSKQQIIQNQKDVLSFNQQWSQRIEQMKNTVNDKKKAFLDLQQEYNHGSQVRSPITGQVINVLVSPGDFANAGKAVVSITPKGKGLDAIVFVPIEQGKRIKPNMAALVFPSIVKKNEYGGIYGKVTHVSPYPVPTSSILSTLQDAELAKKLNQSGSTISVRISLKTDTSTPSGFAWSSSKGPLLVITPGTWVTSRIIVEQRRPISLLIPALRELVKGS